MKIGRWLGVVLCYAWLAMGTSSPAPCSAADKPAAGGLDAAFQAPPAAARPWCYWWWLKANVDKKSITHDLEAMKRAGFGGLLHFDARGYHEGHVVPPESRMEFMSPQWREMLKFSVREAARLGLEVSVNLSSCAGALKGPWEVGDDAPKRLAWNALEIRGPQKFSAAVPTPDAKSSWDVALFAVRSDSAAASPADQWQDVAAKLVEMKPAAECVDLTAKLDAQGRLAWDVPAGRWLLVRFVCLLIPGHEYDVDVMDPKAVAGHFNRMGKAILDDVGPLAGKTLSHFYSVSWEGTAPTWTLSLEQEFTKYRGYNIRPWLPTLAGFTLKSREQTERFRRDYFKTLGDTFRENFYGTMQDLTHRAGLKWHSESGGPWDRKLVSFTEADQLAYLARNDMPQGEFWYTGPASKRAHDMNRPQAMTAHIYGKRLAATEAFTHMVQHWSAYPAALKPFGDIAFCDGVNHFIWHTFTASPPELGKPGSEYFAGTHINPNITWFPQARPFIDYLSRCQLMLRQGLFVADVCTYIGDKPYQHWGRNKNWSPKATLKLEPGYAYDLVNTEVLLTRMTVKNGRLTLPDGMSYRLLALDLEDESLPPEALRKIIELGRAGATIVLGQRQPQSTPGLQGFAAGSDAVRRLAGELWGANPAPPATRALGKGKVLVEPSVNTALRAQGVLPDYEGPWDYSHRRADGADIYYVAGSGTADCTFRVSGKEPELWDPTTGRIRDAVAWRATDDGRAIVPLTLPENGATFVVFRKPAQKQRLAAAPAGAAEIVGRDASGAQVRTWDQGEMPLAGPWPVRFEGGRGAPSTAMFPELIGWEKHANPGIKFFSGQAVYQKKFSLTAEQARQLVRLDLGEVKYIARVRLNNKDLGVVWTAPWSIDLTAAVRPGENQLEIGVTNLWVNRLIGDAGLPPEKRIAKTNVVLQAGKRTVKVYQGFASEDPLMPSGLLGPVRLQFGQLQTKPW